MKKYEKEIKVICIVQIILGLALFYVSFGYVQEFKKMSFEDPEVRAAYQKFSNVIRSGNIDRNKLDDAAKYYEKQYDLISEHQQMIFDAFQLFLLLGFLVLLPPLIIINNVRKIKKETNQ